MNAAALNRHSWSRWLPYLLACLPLPVALHLLVRYWVNVPIWDEWDTPGNALVAFAKGSLSWAELFAQHNESRKFFPRLIYLALSGFGPWDVRASMLVTFLSLCAASGFCFWILRRSGQVLARSLVAAWLLINLLLFGPSQYENLLSGFMFEVFLTALCLFGMVAVNLSRLPLPSKCVCNAALAFVATYTFAHGMFLWLFGLPIPAERDGGGARTRTSLALCYATYFAAGALSVAAYFIGYERPDIAPPVARFSQLPQLLDFFVVWLGEVLQPEIGRARIAGAITLAVFVFAVAFSLALLLKQRLGWRSVYPWVTIGAWAAFSGIVTAVGRVNLGLEAVFRIRFIGFSGVRYNGTAVFCYIAAVALLLHLYFAAVRAQPHLRWRLLTAAAICCVVFAGIWLSEFAAEVARLKLFRQSRQLALTAVRWVDVMPNNPELFFAYPYRNLFRERVDEMERLHVTNFQLAGESLAQAVAATPPTESATGGYLESAAIEPGGVLRLVGQTQGKGDEHAIDFVVVGWEQEPGAFHPFTAVAIRNPQRSNRWPRSDSPKARTSAFNHKIDAHTLPAGRLTLKAWAVDFRSQQAFPMAGSFTIGDRNSRR